MFNISSIYAKQQYLPVFKIHLSVSDGTQIAQCVVNSEIDTDTLGLFRWKCLLDFQFSKKITYDKLTPKGSASSIVVPIMLD